MNIKKILSHRFVQKVRAYVVLHKAVSAVVFIVVIFFGYKGVSTLTSSDGETRYVLQAVSKGTIVTSVTGSGQVSVSNQVEVKPRVSGDVVYLGVKNGQEVKAGTLLLQIDARDAQKAVRDAEVNLENARLSLLKQQKPADALSIIQAENTLLRAKESKANAQGDLLKAYEDGFNTTANAFLDLPTVMSGLQDMLFRGSADLGQGGQWNVDYYASMAAQYDIKAEQFKTDVYAKHAVARKAYDQNFQNYKSVNRSSDQNTIETIIKETYETTKDIAEVVKSANNLIQFYKDELTKHGVSPKPLADTHLTSIQSYTGDTNSHLLNLLQAATTIKDSREQIVNAERTIVENTESLLKLKAGADSLDIQSTQLTLKQRENSLLDAREKLSDYFVRAPFSGTITQINVKKGDAVSGGGSVFTLITKQQMAEISLNEVDVAKVKVGEKVTLTFDAVENLSIAGEVLEVDVIGTVSQGVVTYGVKIGFGTQDDRVKPGMSVGAAIITDVKSDVLLVSNSAVKLEGDARYVEMLNGVVADQTQGAQGVISPTPPKSQAVEVGLSNDLLTEIISGLKEGDQVITRTISPSVSQSTSQQAPSLFGAGGGRGAGGGAFRAVR